MKTSSSEVRYTTKLINISKNCTKKESNGVQRLKVQENEEAGY